VIPSTGWFVIAVIYLKLTKALDAQLREQAQLRRQSKSELVRRALTVFLHASGRWIMQFADRLHSGDEAVSLCLV
jgi:hypothetical protein